MRCILVKSLYPIYDRQVHTDFADQMPRFP